MATREQLAQALREAHSRAQQGDEQAAAHARRLAQAISQMEQAPAQEEPQGGMLDSVKQGYRAYGDFLKGGVETGAKLGTAAAKGLARGGRVAGEGVARGATDLAQLPGAILNQAPRLANIIPGVEGVGPITEDYGGANREFFRRIGLTGVTEPQNRAEEAIMAGGQAVGGAAVGGGALSLGMRGAQGTSMAGRMGRDIADTMTRRPAMFFGTDFTGGLGADLGADAGEAGAEMAGFGETGQQIGRGVGALVGGVAGGTAPALAPDAARGIARSTRQHLGPLVASGERPRAAAQLQRQVASPDDPDAAMLIRRAADAAESAPPGVTPARATREPGLIAQENRLAMDNPSLGRRIRAMSESAQADAVADVRIMAGASQDPRDWSRAMIERVSPPGARVDPGDLDQMLGQSYQQFNQAYRQFDGFPVDQRGLVRNIGRAIADPDLDLLVTPAARTGVRSWMNNQLRGLTQRGAQQGELTSGDLIDFRHNIRERARELRRSPNERNDEIRAVLERVEQNVTRYLADELPTGAGRDLRNLDNQYRQFKLLEDAAYRGGEAELSPQRVLDSIRRGSASRGQYTRGDQEALRQAVSQGMSGDDLLRDHGALRRATRGLSAEAKRPVQAKLLDTITNRAKTQLDESGDLVLNGRVMREQIRRNEAALRLAGMDDADINRLTNISQKVMDMQRKTPEELSRAIDDGPGAMMDLLAAVSGARIGSKIAGDGGTGPQLVLSNHMSRESRSRLAMLYDTKTTKLLEDAATDPKLYAALLRTKNATFQQKQEAGAILSAWLLNEFPDVE